MRALLSILFAAYFLMWLAGGINLRPAKLLPEWMLFFTRSACLFPNAAVDSVDYYAEGWDCTARRWVEIDTRPYFPLVISGRESRFERIVHLFRRNQRVLEALRSFLILRYNDDHPQAPLADVRLLSARTPVPPPGAEIARYQHRPLAGVPLAQQKLWSHYVPLPVRQERCQALLAGQSIDLSPTQPEPPTPRRQAEPAGDGEAP